MIVWSTRHGGRSCNMLLEFHNEAYPTHNGGSVPSGMQTIIHSYICFHYERKFQRYTIEDQIAFSIQAAFSKQIHDRFNNKAEKRLETFDTRLWAFTIGSVVACSAIITESLKFVIAINGA